MSGKKKWIFPILLTALTVCVWLVLVQLTPDPQPAETLPEWTYDPVIRVDEQGNTYEVLVPSELVDEWESYQRERERIASGETLPPETGEIPDTLYEKSYAIASEEQKRQLEQIQAANEWGSLGECTRAIMIVMGDLSADTPRLTLSQARDICEKLEGRWFLSSDSFEQNAVRRFDKIAGAPDFQGGSGIYRYVYYLDDEQTESITVMLGSVRYSNEETGESEVLVRYE